MLTENQKIMREIHNEQQDLESSVTGRDLLQNLSTCDYIDKTTKSLLWRSAKLKQTFFGAGFLEEFEDKSPEMDEEDDERTNALQNILVKSMLSATVEYNDNDLDTDPVHFLAKILSRELVLYGEKLITEEVAIILLGNLIECETLASWLLVCKLEN